MAHFDPATFDPAGSPPKPRRMPSVKLPSARRTLRTLRTIAIWAGLLAWAAAGVGALRFFDAKTRAEIAARPGGVTVQQGSSGAAVEAFAAQFASEYLTYGAGGQTQWLASLRPYVAQGVDLSQAWDGTGTEQVLEVLPVGETKHGKFAAVVIAAEVTGGRWLTLSIPVVTRGGLSVTGAPALVPSQAPSSWTPRQSFPMVDTAASTAVGPVLAQFFGAYAASDRTQLAAYSTPGAQFRGLAGEVRLERVAWVRVDETHKPVKPALVAVTWQLPSGAQMEQTYQMGLRKEGRWLIASLAPAGGDAT